MKNLLLVLVVIAAPATALQTREVATLTQPLVARLQTEGDSLQKRMALQRRAFELQAQTFARQEQNARGPALVAEQDWRMTGNTQVLAQLTVLREGDAALIADPIASISGPTVTAASKQPAIDLSALKSVISGLDRLKGKGGMSFVELAQFAAATNDALVKLNAEQPEAAAAVSTAK